MTIANGETDRKTERQAERQTDTQAETDTQKQIYINKQGLKQNSNLTQIIRKLK